MMESNKTAEYIPGTNEFLNIEGFIQSLTEEPTYKPRKLSDQIVLVTTGGSTAVYIYDRKNTAWKYVLMT